MIKRKTFYNLIAASLVISAAAGLSGCSLTSTLDRFRNPEKLNAELHNKPRFWYDCSAYSERDGLSILSNEFFKNQPFNDIYSFGDNVLLAGQGAYVSELTDFEFEKEATYEYTFSLYNPWKNEITATLDHNEFTCDNYKIVGDQLFLINHEKNTLDIYSNDLKFLQRINWKEFGDISSFNFYPGMDEDHFLAFDYIDNKLFQYDRTTYDTSEYDLDVFSPVVEAVSQDGQQLLLSCVDKTYLRREIRSIDTSTSAVTDTLYGTTYAISDVSDDAFITALSSVPTEWVYCDSKNDTKLYYSSEDINRAVLLSDGSFIFQKDDWGEDESQTHSITFYHISEKGETLSSFSMDCGDASKPGYLYFSSNFAYLEEADAIMFLNYTTDVNPYVLVWDLTKTNSNSHLDIRTAPAEEETPEPESVPISPELSQANEIADEIEEKYSVEVFIGEEIPESIAEFQTEVLTYPDTVLDAANMLKDILSCYPDNFFSQLCYGDFKQIEFYLSGAIASDSEDTISAAGGFVTTEDDRIIMVLDASYSWDWSYTVNHEISHMIDRRLDYRAMFDPDSDYSDDKWCSHNPEDFTYLYSYSNYEDNYEAYNRYSEYFIDVYGTTFPTEDRAEVFGRAMSDYMNGENDTAFFQDNSPVRKKLSYYSSVIREGFDTSGWDESTPWETMLLQN